MTHEKRRAGRRPSTADYERHLSNASRQANRRAREAAAYIDALILNVRTLRYAIATRDIPGADLNLLALDELAEATVAATLSTSAPSVPSAPDFQDLRDQLRQIQSDAWDARDEVRMMRGVEKMRREIVTHDSRKIVCHDFSEASAERQPAVQDTEYTLRDDPRQVPLIADLIVSHDFSERQK